MKSFNSYLNEKEDATTLYKKNKQGAYTADTKHGCNCKIEHPGIDHKKWIAMSKDEEITEVVGAGALALGVVGIQQALKARKAAKKAKKVAAGEFRQVADSPNARARRDAMGENVDYLKNKDGDTFVIANRDTKGMAGKQDKFTMFVSKNGKRVREYGSHPSLDGARKFAITRGFNKRHTPHQEKTEGES